MSVMFDEAASGEATVTTKSKAAPKPGTRGNSPKSDFIRSLPKDTPVADVLAKAKAAGISVTGALVYAVRGRDKRIGLPKRARKALAAAAAPRGRKPSSKLVPSDFIRTQSTTAPASEIVAAGAKKGLKFSTGLVYAVRSTLRRDQLKSARSLRSTAASVAGRSRRPHSHHHHGHTHEPAGDEASFRKAALGLGIARAREVLDDIESRLQAIINGGL